jgi:putative membrane protein
VILRWLLAALHLLALGIGMGAVLDRAATLRGPLDDAGLRRVFRADSLWGIAALLWISTGLVRLFANTEKATSYYLHSHVFWTKMALLIVILVLESRAALTIGGWRRAVRNNAAVDTSRAPALARTSVIEAVLIVLLVFAATAMARGVGAGL